MRQKGKGYIKSTGTSRGLAGLATKKLILENAAEGKLIQIVNDIKSVLKAYPKVVLNSIGMVIGDASFLFKLAFGRLKSGSTYRKMRSDAITARQRRLGNISSGMKEIEGLMGDNGYLCYAIAPGVCLTNKAIRSATFNDDFTNETLESLGVDRIPIVGGIISPMLISNQGAFENLDWSDQREVSRTVKSWLEGNAPGTKKPPSETGIIGKAWDWTQKVFLLDFSSEAYWHSGSLLQEGDEYSADLPGDWKDFTVPQWVSSYDDFLSYLAGWLISQNVSSADDYLEERKKSIDPFFTVATKSLELFANIAATDDIDAIFENIDKLSEMTDNKVDTQSMRNSIKEKSIELSKDKKVKSEFIKIKKSEIKKMNEESQNKAFLLWLEQGIIASSKSSILQEMSKVFEDLNDLLEDIITDGIDPGTLEELAKYEDFDGLIEQIEGYRSQIKSNIAPLLRKVEQNS